MSIKEQQYANLADHTYDRQGIGLKNLVGKQVSLEDVLYDVLEHVDKPSGYQGTIYQRVDTGEIVVSHRGTEFGREALKDGLLADGGMVLARTNSQARDAIELTRDALRRAKDSGADFGVKDPEVTVTGHSLGGTLAQITAHHFDLRGETFNAYGAASLGYRIPEGGRRVLNHVMAADAVSSASPHYGQVRIYAKPGEIVQLNVLGYNNVPIIGGLVPQNVLAASVNDSHMMHNFLNVDGDGRSDVSTLRDPKARPLATENARLIDRYRDDVGTLRGAASLVGDTGDVLRYGPAFAPQRAVRKFYDGLQRDLEPGEPARLERQSPVAPRRSSLESAPETSMNERRPASIATPSEDPIAARFKDSLPGISDEKAAQLALQARMQAGIVRGDQLAHIARNGDSVVAFSQIPGLRTDPMDLRQPAPSLQETREQSLALELQVTRDRDQAMQTSPQVRMA